MTGVIDLLPIMVEEVPLTVGEAPRHTGSEPDEDRRLPRKGHSIDVHPVGGDQMGLIPDRWEREIEMRVAGQKGVTVCRAAGRDGPVVRAGAKIIERGGRHCCRRTPRPGRDPRRREVERQGAPRPTRHDRLQRRLRREQGRRRRIPDHRSERLPFQIGVLPAQGVGHPLVQVKRVLRSPGAGPDTEKMVLVRQGAGPKGPQLGVHPLGIRLECATGGGGGIERSPERVGQVRQAELAHLPVEGEGGSSDPFGEGPLGCSGLEVELEEAIAGVQPAECTPSIEVGGGEKVGNASPVDQSLDRKGEGGDGDDPITRWIGIPGHTPDPGPGVEEGTNGREGPEPGPAQDEDSGGRDDPKDGKGAGHRELWG